MAFQTKGPQSNTAAGASLGPASGQSATPPGDALTSQLPVKVYSGNKKPLIAAPPFALILAQSAHKGYFSSPGSYSGVRAVPLNPLSWNGQPEGGAPSGGQSGGKPKKPKTKTQILRGQLSKGSKGEAVATVQGRTGRMSTGGYSKKSMAPLPRTSTIRKYRASARSRPYIPKTLGGGVLIGLPKQ